MAHQCSRCLSSLDNERHSSSICQTADVEVTMSFNVTVQINLLPSRSRSHLEFSVNGNSIVSKLKRRVERRIHIRASKITMYYKQREVRNDYTFYDVGMGPGSVLSMYIQVSKGSEFDFDYLQLEPQFENDFTNEKPQSGERYIRGGFKYERPYGWYRVALYVYNRYENDEWLGHSGIRKGSTLGEWPVAYHGTRKEYVNDILRSGFIAGNREQYGRGVYTSPSLESAAKYATPFVHTDGDSYQVVIQVRVNPAADHLKRIARIPPKSEYWLSFLQDPDMKIWDTRPYGILPRKVPPKTTLV